MANPFDNPAGQVFVLANGAGQRSLWPFASAAVPPGWDVVFGPADHEACTTHIVEHRSRVRPRAFEGMRVDHVGFFVADADVAASGFVDGYGFASAPVAVRGFGAGDARTASLRQGRIELLLTEPLVDDHPGTAYVERHGDGVADIALGVPDAAAAYAEAVRRGARPVAPPTTTDGAVTATVMGFGDVAHTFVQRAEPTEPLPPAEGGPGLSEVDHFAVCVEAGQLAGTVAFYRTVLDFETVFSERIVVGTQAMDSTVVQSRSGGVTFTLIAPDPSCEPGQIDTFLKDHGGPGVQHVAFATDDVVRAVGTIGRRGVEFLTTPDAYYGLLSERVEVTRHDVPDLARLGVLVDSDHDGQLFQIFARSTHPRGTLFMEVIERFGARTFGSSNITALYEAVEVQRDRDRDRSA